MENVTATAPRLLDDARRTRRGRYLMCPPAFFGVEYRINPWMDPARPVDRARAVAQWEAVVDAYTAAGDEVVTVEPVPGLPDMVFAANAGIVAGGRVLLSRFRHPERAGEEQAYDTAFRALGFTDVTPASYVNEGEGDYLRVGGQ